MAAEVSGEYALEIVERPGGILRYRKEELLSLHDACEHFQEVWWKELLLKLGPEVAEELQELQAEPEASHFRRRSKNSERRQRSKAKREALHAISVNALEPVRDGNETDQHDPFREGSFDSSWQRVNENSGRGSHTGKMFGKHRNYYDDDNEETESFQPRAFAVEGEPDFESGPPQDGWEYLRRVKYEAAHCPKVVVATIDPTKLVSEQTQYMPEMPEIPICPPDLLPSKEWEILFLADFSMLRMALSNMYVPPISGSERVPSVRNKVSWEMRCFGFTTRHDDCLEHDINEVAGDTAQCCKEDSASAPQVVSQPCPDTLKSEVDFLTMDGIAIKTLDGTIIEDRDTNGSTEGKEFKKPSCISPKGDCVMSKSKLQPDNGKETDSFAEPNKTKQDDNPCAESLETNYVIDLSLLKPLKAAREYNVSSNDSEYLISGYPTDVLDEADVRDPECGFPHIHESEEDPALVSEPKVTIDVTVTDLGACNTELHELLDKLKIADPELGQCDDVINGNSKDSVGDTVLILHCDVEPRDLETGSEIDLLHLQRTGPADADIHIEETTSYFEAIEDQHLTEVTDFLPGSEESFDHVEFEELCDGLDYQFEYLTIADHDLTQTLEEMDAMIPSFSYPESSEIVDVVTDQLAETDSFVGLEVFHSGKTCDEGFNEYVQSGDFKLDEHVEQLFDKVFQLVEISQLPFIHLLLRMDEVSRAALFRYHVSWLENLSGLPQDRALWLLALSAVVDTPLNAETSAAFRALLRYCAQVRSLKQGGDGEDLYLLNALIVVAGKYFGQAEKTFS